MSLLTVVDPRIAFQGDLDASGRLEEILVKTGGRVSLRNAIGRFRDEGGRAAVAQIVRHHIQFVIGVSRA